MYAESFGISLTDISVALLVSRLLCESLGSLLVGALSDRTHTRFGRRKPWIVAGSLLGVFGVAQLYSPVGHPGAWHLALWMSFVYLAWNMFDLPYTAWGNELTRDYEDRARLSLWRQGFTVAGVLGLAWLPLAVSPTHEIDWEVLRWVTWISAISLPIVVAYAISVVPRGPHVESQVRLTWRQALKTVATNRPFAFFLAFGVLFALAAGMSAALFFLFYTSYLGLGSWFPLFTTTTTLVSLLSLPLWMRLIRNTSKNRMLVVASTGFVFTLPMVHLMTPGPNALWMYALYDAMWTLFYGAFEVATRAVLGDIIDYDTFKTRRERAGEYCAIWAFVVRGTLAVSASLGFAVAGWYGYDPSAAENGPEAVLGLKLSLGAVPLVFAIAAAGVALLQPMTRARHDIVRRRLERRAAHSV
jgi:Na+/melibiose symporter-like transporter